MKEYSGGGDPARSLALLWRKQNPRPTRNGKQNLSVDRILLAAIEVADADGLGALSMRRVAEKLGVGTMSLYTYVPGKGELIDLMLDTAYGETDKPEQDPGTPWRTRLEQIAMQNWALYHRHPWILQAGVSRPPLGPNVTIKYEYELSAIDGIGLTHIEMDTVLNLVIGHTETAARRDIDSSNTVRDTGMTDQQWWDANGPLLSAVMDPSRFPLASAVGQAVGNTYGTAYDAAHNFEFGLQRILDGVEVLVNSRPKQD
jgi:AcrR family transcriptional regulator